MGLIFRSLCFAIIMHEVISDLGEDVVFDILSNRLDYVSLTLAKIARKQKDIDRKLEINANLIGSSKEHEQHSGTSSDCTESGLIEELNVLKKAISSEKEYVRSLENKIDAIIANQPSFDDKGRRSERQREKSADQTESTFLSSRMQVIETEFKSFESLTNTMENRIVKVETDLESIESVTNFLENRTHSIEENLESVEQVTASRLKSMEKDVETIEKEKSEIENKLEMVVNDVESVETITDMIKLRVDSVENTIDFVELASDGLVRRMDTMESTITVMTETAKKKVGFFAQYKPPPGGHAGIILRNRVIGFRHVIYNEGSGFNATSGIFTVPVSGVYQFVFFVEGWLHKGDFSCPAAVVQLFVDQTGTTSVAFAEAWHLKQHIQAGNQYVNYLRKGQQVTLGTANTCEEHTISGYRTSFSGVLLY